MLKKKSIRVLPGLIVLFVLSACQTTPFDGDGIGKPSATESSAQQAIDNEEYVLAAAEYQELASRESGSKKATYLMRSVELLVKSGQYEEAKELLATLSIKARNKNLIARRRVSLALIAGYEGAHEKAAQLLKRAARVRGLDPTVSRELYQAYAQTEIALNNPLNAVKKLIKRERYLAQAEDVDHNQLQIWEILSNLGAVELKRAQNLSRDKVLKGWLKLAITRYQSKAKFRRLIKKWKELAPDHPITKTTLATLEGDGPVFVGHVAHIAVLLPLGSSRYKYAANAVKEGIRLMFNRDPRASKPSIRFYDIGEELPDVTRFYNKAIEDGADFVIGPLGQEAVDELTSSSEPEVPTLVLGHTDRDLEAAGTALFQFSLAPEQDAKQVAERAFLDGHRQMAVLYPESDWGLRIYTAFIEQWQRLGGVVISQQQYQSDQEEYSEPVKQLLNVTQSEIRKSLLESVVHQTLKFRPRRRQDIDSVFLIADAKHGRLIKPQLNLHRASRLPVYATSRIFTGKASRMHDIDLDGIIFGDMPWLLADKGLVHKLRLLQGNWPYARTQLDRLYALGMDAYAVIPFLNRISWGGGNRYRGVTSGITIDQNGRFQRQLLWARFRSGIPRLIDKLYKQSGKYKINKGLTEHANSSRTGKAS